jgi:hypothetical protein
MAAGRKTGGGSRKGRPNKIAADIKAAILAAFDKAGGADYLYQQSQQNPVAFMGLLAKVLPLQVTGNADEPIKLTIVRYDDVDIGTPRNEKSYVGGEWTVSSAIIDAEPVPEPTVAPAAATQPPPSALPSPSMPDSAGSMRQHAPLAVVPNPNRDRCRI